MASLDLLLEENRIINLPNDRYHQILVAVHLPGTKNSILSPNTSRMSSNPTSTNCQSRMHELWKWRSKNWTTPIGWFHKSIRPRKVWLSGSKIWDECHVDSDQKLGINWGRHGLYGTNRNLTCYSIPTSVVLEPVCFLRQIFSAIGGVRPPSRIFML